MSRFPPPGIFPYLMSPTGQRSFQHYWIQCVKGKASDPEDKSLKPFKFAQCILKACLVYLANAVLPDYPSWEPIQEVLLQLHKKQNLRRSPEVNLTQQKPPPTRMEKGSTQNPLSKVQEISPFSPHQDFQ